MSSKTILVCDRCGKEISGIDFYYNLGNINIITGRNGSIISSAGDYCKDCYKNIITELYNELYGNIKLEEPETENNTENM